jgi:hypothetical protein
MTGCEFMVFSVGVLTEQPDINVRWQQPISFPFLSLQDRRLQNLKGVYNPFSPLGSNRICNEPLGKGIYASLQPLHTSPFPPCISDGADLPAVSTERIHPMLR